MICCPVNIHWKTTQLLRHFFFPRFPNRQVLEDGNYYGYINPNKNVKIMQ